MTREEFTAKGISLYGRARWQRFLSEDLGVGAVTIGRYANGKAEVPKVVALAMSGLKPRRPKENVYSISSLKTGRRYFGVTTFPDARWRQHVVASKTRSQALYEDMQDHGIEAFSFEVIEAFDTRDEAIARETQLIGEAKERGEDPYNVQMLTHWKYRPGKGSSEEIRAAALEAIKAAGGLRAWCRDHGMNPSAISRYLSGHRNPSSEMLRAIEVSTPVQS